jgi:pullulanase/glycogen debranching enzyme
MGVPMLAAGDEAGRTQHGDDNAYCQDNEISWIDWEGADPALRSFATELIALRAAIPWLQSATWPGSTLTIRWWWPDGRDPQPDDWAEPRSDLGLLGERNGAVALLILNAGPAEVTYDLPPLEPGGRFTVAGCSVVVLLKARASNGHGVDAPQG